MLTSKLRRTNRVKPSDLQSEMNSIRCLKGGAAMSMRARRGKNLHLHVLEGRAWITYDRVDVIVDTGETVAIPSTKQPIVISPVNRSGICYEVIG